MAKPATQQSPQEPLPGPPILQRSQNSLIIGAAIGTGIAARAAARGGADFLIAVNSARFRMMGASSAAGHVALRNNNQFVEGFAAEEILLHSEIPVFFGTAVFDPRMRIGEFIPKLRDAGFAGVANSRSGGRYTGGFRLALERAGLGVERDLELFAKAREVGLLSLAYARNLRDATLFGQAGVDLLCLSFGPNSGEFGEAPRPLRIEDASELARNVVRTVRRESPRTLCLVTGAPIIDPDQMLEVCAFAKADGYVGGSTIDRLPLQQSVETRTAEFKQAILRAGPERSSRRRLSAYEQHYGIVAESASMQQLLGRIGRIVDGDLCLHLSGPEGAGKSYMIACLSSANARGRRIETLACRAQAELDLMIALVGCAPGASPGADRRRIGWLETLGAGTLILDGIERTTPAFQDFVAEIWTAHRFQPIGGLESYPLATRLICTSRASVAELREEGMISGKLADLLRPHELVLPPLAARIDDIPRLVAWRLSALRTQRGRGPLDIDQSVVRNFQRRDWPGNVRELFSLIDEVAAVAAGERITPKELRRPVLARRSGGAMKEREWILEALRRNRYRRGETAAFLGITRKTLYNKMKRYGISVNDRMVDHAP